jgi:TRAP-type C4-dicarboxylate transport system permease small subunit
MISYPSGYPLSDCCSGRVNGYPTDIGVAFLLKSLVIGYLWIIAMGSRWISAKDIHRVPDYLVRVVGLSSTCSAYIQYFRRIITKRPGRINNYPVTAAAGDG